MGKMKRLGGFSNIHIAKLTGSNSYETPKKIEGAKSVEVSLNYENVQFYADNAIDYSEYIFSGGEGTLTVSGLTPQEYGDLFGSTVENGVVKVKTSDIAPELALLFERKILGTNETVKYVVYAVKFAPTSISANTMEGSVTEENFELTFSVRETESNDVYTFVNTQDDTDDAADNWYSEVYTK